MSRNSPLEMNSEEFRRIGHELVDSLSSFFKSIEKKKVTTAESAEELQKLIGNLPVPEDGTAPGKILSAATELLLNHSLLNGHPRFFGYITASPAPIGALADLLASSVNPNVGASILSPVATEIEKQTIRWIADLVGLPSHFGGILVSGGNMANFNAFLAARTLKGPKNIKEEGLPGSSRKLLIYCSRATHIWIEKATILFGLGSNSIRWIATENNRMDIQLLEKTILEDLNNNNLPMMVVGNAGDVSTGATDDLETIALICRRFGIWFHVDGAYGLPAAIIPEMKPLFKGIEEADSIAMDPHKWLYSPLEAGCTLIRDMDLLKQTFSFHPVYYNFSGDDEYQPLNYYEYGLQNSRGFRALKVWLAIQQAGRKGYEKMIAEDIRLSKLLYKLVGENHELEAVTQNLSITTLRYVPEANNDLTYLNELNEALANDLQTGGEAFLSNAIIDGKYCLRACIVNFRTSEEDVVSLIDIIINQGRKIHKKLREKTIIQV